MSPSTSSPTRIAVTGGRGRLAALLAGHFRQPQFEVVRFSRDAGEDFRDPAGLAATLPGCQSLLHLAWSTLPATSERNPGIEWQTDLPALEKILRALAAVPPERRPHLIFFSTGGAVYGNAPGRPSVETDPCRPIGQYGRAKLAAEQLIEDHAARHGLAAAILRISNPYGYPVPKDRMQGIIPHAVRCALTGQPLTLWGDGHARKDFLYYSDFLSAMEQVIAHRLTGTFNLSAGESHSVREVIALVEKHSGKKIDLIFQPGVPWDVEDSRLSNQRLVAATGWKPHIALDEGIHRALVQAAP